MPKDHRPERAPLTPQRWRLCCSDLSWRNQCVEVPHSKENEEVFYDLPLDVKGSGTLQKSLDRCVRAHARTVLYVAVGPKDNGDERVDIRVRVLRVDSGSTSRAPILVPPFGHPTGPTPPPSRFTFWHRCAH